MPPRLLPAFDELAPSMDSGDVLLFGGESRFCRTLKRLMGCRWSHAALVARPHAGGPLLLWEATLSSGIPDVVTREARPGVSLYDLRSWITHYADETAIRRLHVERTDAMRAALLAFYQEANGRPYERSRLQMVRSMLGRLLTNHEPDTSSLFCSELVAEALQRMGVLAARPPSNAYSPKDFSAARRRPLPLRLGATLGPEVVVCGRPGAIR
ncbi:MAG: hypothetical protein ACRC33_06690 [Gemmataceae bacterium]